MTSGPKRVRIGEVLLEAKLLTEKQLEEALVEQKRTGKFLGQTLVEQGLVTGEQLVAALARRLGVKGCRLRSGMADPSLLATIGEEEALRLNALPLMRVRDTMTVAMAEPQSLPSVDRLRQLTGCNIRPVLALEDDIRNFIRQLSGPTAGIDSFVASLAETEVQVVENEEEGPVTDLDVPAEGSPVVNLVNMILLRSVADGASDIHIEPDKNTTRVRYRIDGMLRNVTKPLVGMHSSIISRVKVIGRMDIAERRLPQEGRVRISAQGREIDLRVSSMPTVLGEKIVIRILDKANLEVHLGDLGFRPETLTSFLRMLRCPHGLVLVTGPTGSGKTTTLYSALSLIRTPETNIVTVEDPVEYQLDLINQIQVQESIGMTFARALRSILRQDPDVIMVGEIRDEETARVGVQAALTGHLVLATLHTNDAAGAVARLMDMGIPPYLLSGALNGVVAQRLVRTVCQHCAEPYQPEPAALEEAGLPQQPDHVFTRGAGCSHCHGSGFSGRTGVYEVMEITGELRRLIRGGAVSQELSNQWQRQGGWPLRREAVAIALAGRSSLEEVLGATHSENETSPGPAGQKLEGGTVPTAV